jgi:glycine cleavage system transcriptional repressor
MEKRFILTAFGKDRPGIAADVSQVIYENGCNLEDSSMALLASEFTLMLVFTGSGEDLEERLQKECRHLEVEKGISVFIRPLDETLAISSKKMRTRTLRVEGQDKAGIVYRISRFLSDNNVNIDDLRSKKTFMAQSGTPLYLMKIHIQIPQEVSLDDLDEGLSRIADELNVDIAYD